MLACIHYSQLPLFCWLLSSCLHSFFPCLSPGSQSISGCLWILIQRGLCTSGSFPLFTQQQARRGCWNWEERLINTGPVEAWLHPGRSSLSPIQEGEPGAGGGGDGFNVTMQQRTCNTSPHIKILTCWKWALFHWNIVDGKKNRVAVLMPCR